MNFSGYVPMRRGILDHTMSGELSLQEFAAFTVLVLLADKASGRGRINAPVLRTYLPGLSEDGAKRVLTSLENKCYIFRQITPRSPLVYPYWVNRYRPTVGPHKLRQLSLEQVFQSKDPKDIHFVELALDTALETPLDTAPEGAQYNKKEKKKEKKNETPSTNMDSVESNRSPGDCMVSTVDDAKRQTWGAGGERLTPQWCAADASPDASVDAALQPFGLELRDGRLFGKCGEIDASVLEKLELKKQ